MKKILFIAPFEAPHITRWFDYFNNSNEIDAHLLICDHLRNNKNIFTKIITSLLLKRRVIRYIENINPEIVNLHTLLFPNYLLAKGIKYKLVITPWNGDIVWYKYGKELFLLKYVKVIAKLILEWHIKISLNKASLITYNSNIMKERIKLLLANDIPIANIAVPGTDTDKWVKVDSFEKLIIRQEFGLPLNKFILLSPRSLGSYYNIDIIIKAFHLAQKSDDDLFLIIKYNASNELNNLLKLVRNFKIQDKVKFIGSVKYDQVTKYYQASNLIISISSRDASPQSVIESLSCEIPVIVGDIPPLREIIIDNHNGFIVPCRNPQLLASKILYIKTNPEAISVIAENGRKTVIDKYDHISNMRTMLELFKKL